MTSISPGFEAICRWENLHLAYNKAAKGKRCHHAVARFDFTLAQELLCLQQELVAGAYSPGGYVNFIIHEPKRRKISAAAFRDRVVHHALCNIIEPRFERLFIQDSYANRKGKGTHRAVDRLQAFAKKYRYVLKADIVKHFPSIDHQILKAVLGKTLPEADIMALCCRIIDSGAGILDDEYEMHWFPGDDLLALSRPRGLPIGNLTSQFWSNCYLNPFDQFVVRELSCPAYLRYVDDFALFSDSKTQLWQWRQAIIERLQHFRLVIHENSAQVLPSSCGIPWLGFVVYPDYRRVKSRKVIAATRRLQNRWLAWRRGELCFAELDISVQSWINHVRYADTWGLRRHVFDYLAKTST